MTDERSVKGSEYTGGLQVQLIFQLVDGVVEPLAVGVGGRGGGTVCELAQEITLGVGEIVRVHAAGQLKLHVIRRTSVQPGVDKTQLAGNHVGVALGGFSVLGPLDDVDGAVSVAQGGLIALHQMGKWNVADRRLLHALQTQLQ